jgi:L-aminopeptidase/D-esterase-like protein
MRKMARLCLVATLLQGAAVAETPTTEVAPSLQPVAGAQPLPDQSQLKPNTAITGPTLKFDWPALYIGAGTYEEGPTGVTVFAFPQGANAVVDVRGGAPGTVNTDLLRLGYSAKSVGAIVLSGGSAYGEEAIVGIQTGFKDLRGRGHTGIVPGAIVNDLAHLRLNWYYPDRRLAREVLKNLRPGVFPLGAQGAGRMAQNGLYYGCRNHSGQGGAFRQIGDVKIAVFTVVNALGAVVDRQGKLVRCHRDASWPADESAADLIKRIANRTVVAVNDIPDPAIEAKRAGTTRATTISLIVTNRKMSVDDLQRFAVQVHTSMARGIWPFSSGGDGDTLFAASTQEVEVPEEKLRTLDMDVIAGEMMWDAILASVPPEDAAIPAEAAATVPVGQLARLVGRYDFGAASPIDIKLDNGALTIGAETLAYADIPKGKSAKLVAIAADDFYVPGRYRTRIKFTADKHGQVVGAVIDPGLWGQRGVKLK